MGNVYKRPLTLLERWDQYIADGGVGPKNDEIRRAIAIAQAVEEWKDGLLDVRCADDLLRVADELLEGKR